MPSDPTYDELEASVERLTEALRRERQWKREALAEANELKNFRRKFFAARDASELWEYRAKSNLERLKAEQAKTAELQARLDIWED